jgi:hypothetical protein
LSQGRFSTPAQSTKAENHRIETFEGIAGRQDQVGLKLIKGGGFYIIRDLGACKGKEVHLCSHQGAVSEVKGENRKMGGI